MTDSLPNTNGRPHLHPRMYSAGFGMGPGFGFYGGGFGGTGSDPITTLLQWLQKLNYIIYTVGHMMDTIGMNASAIMQCYCMVSERLQQLLQIVKQSEFRKWIKQKSKKSKVLKYLFVFLSMILTSLAIRTVRFVFLTISKQSGNPLTSRLTL
jgi:hypothetical protein